MASYYDAQVMTKRDLDRVDKLQKQWQQATTKAERQKLHDQVEQIRSNYGYSGGADGSEYIVTDAGLAALSGAAEEYADAVDSAAQAELEAIEGQSKEAQRDLEGELKKAYINQLQTQLGLEQQMRAEGYSGGASESIRAAARSDYLGQRNDAKAEASEIQRELNQRADEVLQNAELDKAEAQLKYDNERSDYLVGKEKTEYERAQDRFDNAFSLLKQGVYSPSLASALGISDSEVRAYLNSPDDEALRDLAWKMVQKGYYDPAFPELLGYDEAIIRGYIAQISK